MNNRVSSRTYNTIINSIFGVAAAIVTILLNFVVRVVLVRELGSEIHGLHVLFQNIANVLALMEAQVSTAIVIHLYKPVKEYNKTKIIQIMSFYRRLYAIIAILFALVSFIVDVFFMDQIVTTTIDMFHVRILFAIFALSYIGKYLTYHKRSILFAEEKNRISIFATLISELIFRTLGIGIVIGFQSYYLFLILMLAEVLVGNIICAIYVNKHHPYLCRYGKTRIDEDTKKSIFSSIKPLFVNKISSTVQQSAKGVLVSILSSNVSYVGYFGNYFLVGSIAQHLFGQIGGAFTSSFGNLAVDSDKDRMYSVYKKVALIMNSLAVIICAGYISCIQDFILMAFGHDFVLSLSTVVVITVELLFQLLSVPIISIQNAMGLHNKDRNQMVIQAMLAIVAGYYGGKLFGMNGLLLGFAIPYFLFTLVYKGIVIHKYAFSRNAAKYISSILYELIKSSLVVIVAYVSSCFVCTGTLIFDFLIKGFTAFFVSVILIIILSFRNPSFREVVDIILNKIKK